MENLRLRTLMAQAAQAVDGTTVEGLAEDAWSRARWRAHRPRRMMAWVVCGTAIAVPSMLGATADRQTTTQGAAPSPPSAEDRPQTGALYPSVLVFGARQDALPAAELVPATRQDVMGRRWSPVDAEVAGRALAPGWLTVDDDGTVRVEGCSFALLGEGTIGPGRLRTDHASWRTVTHPTLTDPACVDAPEDAPAWHAALRGSSVALMAGPDVLVLVPDLRQPGMQPARLDLVRAGVAEPRAGRVELLPADGLEGTWRVTPDGAADLGIRVTSTGGTLGVEGPCGAAVQVLTWLVDADGIASSMLVGAFRDDVVVAGCTPEEARSTRTVLEVLDNAPTLQLRGDHVIVQGRVPPLP